MRIRPVSFQSLQRAVRGVIWEHVSPDERKVDLVGSFGQLNRRQWQAKAVVFAELIVEERQHISFGFAVAEYKATATGEESDHSRHRRTVNKGCFLVFEMFEPDGDIAFAMGRGDGVGRLFDKKLHNLVPVFQRQHRVFRIDIGFAHNRAAHSRIEQVVRSEAAAVDTKSLTHCREHIIFPD